ncbi:hypothetical protein L3V82_10305 [Thiotrichales bacterium 19S3-7]|nr:hypothetical protein [Thiotrichales bacterium 19S3-7]MCF6802548.1 hypothetical protein [Thiotrichales bacterium 19S3-11]
MSNLIQWLPKLEELSEYNGQYTVYIEAIYQIFYRDFVESKPIFQGTKLGLKRYPLSQGKEATFWHMVTEGNIENERLIDFRRAERIRWPKPIIENSNSDNIIKIWTEHRNSEERIHLWLYDVAYLIVLNKRKGYILPWTAFPVKYNHQKIKYEKRWKKYKNL